MTALDLDPIRERLADATPGPWVIIGGGEYITPVGIMVAPDDGGVRDVDAEFIAHAPADIAALLAEVERLRAEAHGLTKRLRAVKAIHDSWNAPSSDHYYCEPSQCDRAGEGELLPECEVCREPHPCPTVLAARGEPR